MYEKFADVYDRLMADVNYEHWASYYLELARLHGVEVRRAADCACGTGNLTLCLAAYGVQMTGLDISVDMLRIAGEKARARGMQIPFVRQDISKLLLHRPMDALFCACDGVNYLVRPEDLQAFFAAAYNALRPGGGLFFDISTGYKLAHRLGDNCFGDDSEAVSYIWQNHFNANAHMLQMDLTFFIRGDDGRYGRFCETHFQHAYETDELAQWLAMAGFSEVYVYGDKTFKSPLATEERMHFAAIRRL